MKKDYFSLKWPFSQAVQSERNTNEKKNSPKKNFTLDLILFSGNVFFYTLGCER